MRSITASILVVTLPKSSSAREMQGCRWVFFTSEFVAYLLGTVD
jgi:hypothetical protein